MIEEYTMESGVRGLKKLLDTLCRFAAVKLVKKEGESVCVTEENLSEFLGRKEIHREMRLSQADPGVATGLAWTRAGGEIPLH